jgi:hypothetical protein
VDRSQALACDVRSTVAVSTKVDRVSRTTLKDILLFVLAYLLWLVSIVACIVAVVEFRSTINMLWVMTGHSRWTLGVADQLSVLLGGLLAFVYVVFLESYYRRSVTQQSIKSETVNDVSSPSRVSHRLDNLGLYVLLRRFAWTIAIPIGLLVASLVMRRAAFRFLY